MPSFVDYCTLRRILPFPLSGSGEGLVLAHGDLAGADEYVATIISCVERGIFKPAPIDVLTLLEELVHRIDRLGGDASAGDQAVARSQHAYAALLDLVYRQFLEHGSRDQRRNQAEAEGLAEGFAMGTEDE
ncbi:hypothetical protein AB0M11_31280 [Streptomyces sp. NPDC051987]|uniref:hypothetical protein n=1 Tax=Streptomyces sp. NPDC051987 TaxID=3155808 RepID=UPI003440F051